MSALVGYISQIIGPVVDVHFDLSDDTHGQLPAIYEALSIERSGSHALLVEVQQHIGEDTVRSQKGNEGSMHRRAYSNACGGADPRQSDECDRKHH